MKRTPQQIIGKDAYWKSDAAYVCEVPASLGAVTGLSVQNGRVVAETESGMQMIVPVSPPQGEERE